MNYYELLEISPKASQEVIRAAYKSLMQRYHPDKNPGNIEAARRAALIVQAYGVLSDINQRNAYDFQLKDTPAQKPLTPSSGRNHLAKSSGAAYKNQQAVEKNKYTWYAWGLIGVILVSGSIILLVSNKNQLQAERDLLAKAETLHASQKKDAAVFQKLDSIEKKINQQEADLAGKITPIFSTPLTIILKVPEKLSAEGKSMPPQPEHLLSIPRLLVKAGPLESERFIRRIEDKKETINLELTNQLAYAKYEELIKPDGEKYLKNLILRALRDITETKQFGTPPPSGPDSAGQYGVVDIFLPDSFIVK